MEITKALKKDHDELKKYLKTMNSNSATASKKKTALQDFAGLLTKHSDAEEKVAYNALIETKDDEAQVAGHEGYCEHDVADHVLKSLKKESDPSSPKWEAKAKVIKEMVEHHIKEEEDELFDQLKEHFDTESRKEMGEKFEKLKS